MVPAWFNHQNKIEGIFIHQFCEAMQKSGQGVTLLYVKTYSLANIFNYFKKITIEFECNFEVLIIKKLNCFPSFLFKNAVDLFKRSILKKALNIVNEKKYDVIHIQSVCNNITPFLAFEISKAQKIPLIITEHYTNFAEAGDKIYHPYLNRNEAQQIVAKANYRVAVSKFAAENFSKIFFNEFITIPNIIGEAFIQKPFKKNEFEAGGAFKLIFIGALSKRKGVLELLDALHILIKASCNIQLTMVGDGELRNELKLYVENNKLQTHVNLVGLKTENEIIELLDEHHCLVSASEIETFGLVIVESYLRGRPVVCVDSGAVAELIDSNNGILSSSVDKVNNLVKSINRVINNYTSFNQAEIRNAAMAKFNDSNIISQYLAIYKKAIHEYGSNFK